MLTHRHGAYFISGVDTDSGKTYVTARMAAYLRHRGVSVITQKPVQTGCLTVADDLVEHRKVMGCGILPEDKEGRTCTYLFKKPCSPHLAARLEGVTIDPDRIDLDTRYLLGRYSVVLVEGAGGLMVPLNDDMLTIDYVASRRLPLVLVTTSKLGGINHALLSIEACKNRGIELPAIVFNRLPSDEQIMADDAYQQIKKFAMSLYPQVQMVDFRSSDSFWDVNL
ncbi:MAG: dethiobiotin synthase [Bacteroidales bacterium]|nr:dethiobiotin synthase [Bacteroidales bacterium]